MRQEAVAIQQALAALDPHGPPHAVFVRRAPDGLRGAGTLICLSASFNPITLAHLGLVEAGSRLVAPGEVLLLLSVANVDKAVVGLDLERRIRLLLRVAEGRPEMSVALVSHGRFVDKARALASRYPAGTRLVFLLGLDTLLRLFDPKYYTNREREMATLFSACEVVAAARWPDRAEAVAQFLLQPHVALHAPRIHCVELSDAVAPVSATAVRDRLSRGEDVTDFVPPEILPLLKNP